MISFLKFPVSLKQPQQDPKFSATCLEYLHKELTQTSQTSFQLTCAALRIIETVASFNTSSEIDVNSLGSALDESSTIVPITLTASAGVHMPTESASYGAPHFHHLASLRSWLEGVLGAADSFQRARACEVYGALLEVCESLMPLIVP